MAAQRIIIDSRSMQPWAGNHADLQVINDALSLCFRDIREREQSEWAAAHPEPPGSRPDPSALEKINAEHRRLAHQISRLRLDASFTDFCSYELAHRPIKVTGSYEEVSPSFNSDRIKYLSMTQSYLRDDIRRNASVRFGNRSVEVIVDGTDPLWVESTAGVLAKTLRHRRPRWAPLVTGWGQLICQLALVGVIVAICWRVSAGLAGATSWWALMAVVCASSWRSAPRSPRTGYCREWTSTARVRIPQGQLT